LDEKKQKEARSPVRTAKMLLYHMFSFKTVTLRFFYLFILPQTFNNFSQKYSF